MQVVSAAAGEALQHLQSTVSTLNALCFTDPKIVFTEKSLVVDSLLSALYSVLAADMKEDGVIFATKGHPWDYIRHLGSCMPEGDALLDKIDAIQGLTTMTGATRAFLARCLNSSELTTLISALMYNKELTSKHYKKTAVVMDEALQEKFVEQLGELDNMRFSVSMQPSFLQPLHSKTVSAQPEPEVVENEAFQQMYEQAELAKWNAIVGSSGAQLQTVEVERSPRRGRSRKAKSKKHKRSLSAQHSSTYSLPAAPSPYPGYTPSLEEALAAQLPSPVKALSHSEPVPEQHASDGFLYEASDQQAEEGGLAHASSDPANAGAPVPAKSIRFAVVPPQKQEEGKEGGTKRFWSPIRDPFTGREVQYSPQLARRKTKGRRRSNSAPHDVAYQRKVEATPFVALSSDEDECSDEGEGSSAEEQSETLDQLGRHLRHGRQGASYGTHREVELILTVPEHSQPTDHIVCYTCFQTIEEWEEPRFCHYTGKYFCTECHSNKLSIIPARVVQLWDFKTYSVSDYGLRCIASLYSRPVIYGTETLFKSHPDFLKLKKKRKQLMTMWAVAKHCSDTGAVKQYFGEREYYLVSSHYSLKDLVEINLGQAWSFLVGGMGVLTEHLHTCPVCQKKGVVCSKCLDVDDRLFIFDSMRGKQCASCKAICHVRCVSKKCPQCKTPFPADEVEDDEASFVVFENPSNGDKEEESEEKAGGEVAKKMAGRLVLVIGATSDLGILVAADLIKAGVSVRALTRNTRSARAEELAGLGAEVVHYEDPSEEERLNQAMHGCYAVYAAIEDGYWVAGTMPDGTDVCQGPQALVLEVAERSGVKRIVYCLYGAIAAEDEFRHVHAHRSRGELEKYMWLKTEIAWTVVRPAPLMERFVLPKYQPKYHWSMFKHHRSTNGRKLPLIGLHDLAHCLKEIICEERPLVREVFDLASDELTYEEACASYQDALDKEPPSMRVPLPLWLLSVIHPHLVAAATHFRESDFRAGDVAALRGEYGFLRTFSDYVEEELVTALPPRWVSDEEAPACQQCSAQFTLTKRRHHCRNCGQVLCKRCTSHTASLPWYSIDKPARICSQCYVDHLDKILAENRKPNWESDEVSKNCQNCGNSFSLLSRRHHCRNCGRLLCSECTPHLAGIPKFHYYSPVRICSDCYARSTVIQLGALYRIKHNPIRPSLSQADLDHHELPAHDGING